jgi:hypothetical protein
MEKILNFGDYDLFAYLMVGLAAFVVCDLVFGTRLLFREKWHFGTTTAMLIGAYVFGHIIATPAEWILERVFVGKVLGPPTDHLVRNLANKPNCLAGTIFFDYYKPLEQEVSDLVRKKTKLQGQPLFWTAYAVAKKDISAKERLPIFLKLYAFCRNMSFVALVAAFVVLVQRRRGYYTDERRAVLLSYQGVPDWLTQPKWQFGIFLAAGLGLFLRYLFFYRLYSVEVLVAYATAASYFE